MIKSEESKKPSRLHINLLILFSIMLIVSFIKPKSYAIWLLEASPVIIAVGILIYTYKKFQFTDLVYVMIVITIGIVLIGAHYSYGDVPLFELISKTYGLKRNYYDRLGHIVQGIMSAFIIRELFIRKTKFRKGFILSILVISICLSISAFYELIEWGGALVAGSLADDFLGTQGDKWDTQWDMLCALTGAIITVVMFSKAHDKSISKRLYKKGKNR